MITKQSKLSVYIKAIGDNNRLAILEALKGRPLCVCEIFPLLKLPQNLVSHHLKILKDIGLISNEREGVKIIYHRNEKTINKYQKLLTNKITL
jgi:DNA-binding transcriptional ArsR family regulator